MSFLLGRKFCPATKRAVLAIPTNTYVDNEEAGIEVDSPSRSISHELQTGKWLVWSLIFPGAVIAALVVWASGVATANGPSLKCSDSHTIVVLIYCLQPADVIVGMRDEVYVDLAFNALR